MGRFFSVLVTLMIVLAVIGFFRGWFHADSQNAIRHDTVTLTVDKDKFAQDKATAEQHLHDLEHK